MDLWQSKKAGSYLVCIAPASPRLQKLNKPLPLHNGVA
jgi:hypothetical protein